MNNKPQNRRGGVQAKYNIGRIAVIIVILVVITILSFGISYAHFTASKQISGVTFTFTKLNDMYDENWTHSVGTFSQPMQPAQMAGYGTFTPDSGGEFMQFGWFPQTIKESGVTVTETTRKFAGFDCHLGNNGYLYVKVASPTPDDFGNGLTYSDGTPCSTTTELYFKLEKIIWQILENTSGNKLLFSVKELTAMPYYESASDRTISGTTIYANNYKYSYARAYFNGIQTYGPGVNNENNTYVNNGLLQQAFTTAQFNLIKDTVVDNSHYPHEGAIYEDTKDKIFLLSMDEYSAYTTKIQNGSDPATEYNLYKFPTDYAGAVGAFQSKEADKLYGGEYWSRTPIFPYAVGDTDFAYAEGCIADYIHVSYRAIGFVPALYLSI